MLVQTRYSDIFRLTLGLRLSNLLYVVIQQNLSDFAWSYRIIFLGMFLVIQREPLFLSELLSQLKSKSGIDFPAEVATVDYVGVPYDALCFTKTKPFFLE